MVLVLRMKNAFSGICSMVGLQLRQETTVSVFIIPIPSNSYGPGIAGVY